MDSSEMQTLWRGTAPAATRGMRTTDPVLAEYAQIDREVFRLRRKLTVLYGVIIASGVATFERVIHGIAVADRTRFLLLWGAVFATSLVAFAATKRLRERLDQLFHRTRVLALQSRR